MTGKLEVTDKESLEKCLEAESADEVALVLASAEQAGVILVKRDADVACVLGLKSSEGLMGDANDDNDKETFQVLAVNEFDSHR
jgi:hypothetical protein